MTISFSVFKPKFRKTIADAVYQEVTSKTALYYHWFGKENPWTDFLSPFIGSSAGDFPGPPSNNFRYDLHVRRDILTAKLIKPSDISYVVRRIDWESGKVFDMYDDSYGPDLGDPASVTGYYGAENVEDSEFFILTSDYNVYKCIWNNNNAPSTVMPTSTTEKIVKLSDGYKWKFMYSIPVSLRNRFLTSTDMPVSTALQQAYFSSGTISNIFIQNGGTGYNSATTTAVITGDGYKESDPYKINQINITDVSPDTPTAWIANTAVTLNQYLITTTGKTYQVTIAGDTGSSAPTGTTTAVTNGTATLKYLGTRGGSGYLHNAGEFASVAAGNFVPGVVYTIAFVGTTNFTLIGASSNTVGITFRATGYGSGTGKAAYEYKIDSVGTSFGLTGVSITGSSGQFACTAAASTLYVGQTITITGTKTGTATFTGYANPTTYKISATNGSTTFTLVTTSDVALSTAAGSLGGLSYLVNTTDFTAFGAPNNSVGTTFVPTTAGWGNGTAIVQPKIIVDYPFPSAVNWTSLAFVSTGTYLRVIGVDTFEYYYQVTSGTQLGSAPPTQTILLQNETNGSCQLKYVGKNARFSLGVNSTTNDSVGITSVDATGTSVATILERGLGYQGLPTVYFTSPKYNYTGVSPLTWTAQNAGFAAGNIIKSSGKFYKVISGGTTGTTAPTDITGSNFTNGSVTLKFVGQDPAFLPVIEKTNAEIQLIISPNKDLVSPQFGIVRTGSKYSEVPTVTIASPGAGSTATAYAQIGASNSAKEGLLTNIVLVDGGNGYTTAPAVTVSTPKITFDGSSASIVSIAANTITYTKHKFLTGDEVTYQNGGGTSISIASSAVTNGTTFWIIRDSVDTIKLASSLTNANAGTALDITAVGAGTAHTLQLSVSGEAAFVVSNLGQGGEIVGYSFVDQGIGYTNCNIQVTDTNSNRTFNGATAVDPATDTITLYANDGVSGHGITTGTEIIYNKGSTTSTLITNTAIGGLSSGSTYYAITITATSLKLASSAANATIGTALDLSADGVGTDHQIVIPNAGTGAVLIADFNIGDVQTLQANVELLAVPGSIEAIRVVNGGQNYSSAIVEILGDGTGATATATCTGGKVSHIEIVNPGSGYSWTDILITGNVGSDGGAVVRAIMSPLGGHGSNAIDELNANSLVFYSSLSRDLNLGIEITNDYRKVGLIRNLKQFNSNRRFTEDIGSGCVLVEGVFDRSQLQPDMLLYKVEGAGVQDYKKYRIVDFTDNQILLSVFNNFTISAGDQLITDPTNIGTITNPTVNQIKFTVDKAYERTIDQFSGDFLFFSVREPYSASADQIVTVRTKITL
jgi:hypothetical protein